MLKLEQFQEAKKRVDEVIIPTPLIYSEAFSKECKNEVYIKPENLQRTGAFKIRGAYNKIVKDVYKRQVIHFMSSLQKKARQAQMERIKAITYR